MSFANRNRLGNAGNRYQTDVKKVLALCSAGLLRSPTTANVLHAQYGYNTRAAGVSEDFALVVVDEVLLHWADEIVCVEQSVANKLHAFLADHVDYASEIIPKIVVLDIPDRFSWNDPELREIILRQYADNLKATAVECQLTENL